MTARMTVRLLLPLPDALLSEIDLHRRYYPDLPPRVETIRRLVRKGMDALASERAVHEPEVAAAISANPPVIPPRRNTAAELPSEPTIGEGLQRRWGDPVRRNWGDQPW